MKMVKGVCRFCFCEIIHYHGIYCRGDCRWVHGAGVGMNGCYFPEPIDLILVVTDEKAI